MRFLKHLLGALALGFMAASASASPTNPTVNVEYSILQTPQATDTGKKVEVIEFFAYYCPHCNAFEPALSAWVKKQGDNIVFKRVHVPYNESVVPQQKLFYTLQSMGLLTQQLHEKIFAEMHVAHNRLNRDEQVFDFIAKQGIDRQKFIEVYNSFGMPGQLRKAASMMDAYRIDSWPSIAIDGRFITSPSKAAAGASVSEEQMGAMVLQVMDVLVAKAKAEKK
ncbi:thiol:disulfide interchange protein DsbA/DsbL [Oxalobacteraceae bacterium A2-2]